MKKTFEVIQQNTVLAANVTAADTFMKRFRGLMGRKGLGDGEGLLLLRCGSIHCFFMRFPIDVIYLGKDMTVIAIETVKPWHIGGLHRGAKHVLELAEGKGSRFAVGEPIRCGKEGRQYA